MRGFRKERGYKEFEREFRKAFDGPPVVAMGVKFDENDKMWVGSLWLPVVEEEMTDRECRDLNDLLNGMGVILGGVVKRLVEEWVKEKEAGAGG